MVTHAPLRWGLLCTARINRAVIPPIRSSRKSQLVAVASRDAERASAYASTWGIPRFFSSYEALLEDPDIDVVYISLPNSMHAEWSIKAMQMGKHVLCEKPITTRSSDLEEVAEVALKSGRIITEAFMYRHHPQTLRVKEMIDNGEVGSLQLIQGTFGFLNTRSSDPRFDPALGGGSLWDVGCYPISYACYLTGQMPIEVFGHQVTGATGIDVLYTGYLFFPSGTICQFDCSFSSEPRARLDLTGDKGTINIPEPYKPGKQTKLYVQKSGEKRTIDLKGKELYLGEIEDIENAILEGTQPRLSLMESKQTIQTIEALYKSSRLSRPVKLQTK